jgi:hypothetical protein
VRDVVDDLVCERRSEARRHVVPRRRVAAGHVAKTTLSPSVISRSDPGWVRAMEYSSGAMKPGVR